VKTSVNDKLPIANLVYYLTAFAYQLIPEVLLTTAIREEVKAILIYGIKDYATSMYKALFKGPDQTALYYIRHFGSKICHEGIVYVLVRLDMSGNLLMLLKTVSSLFW
jgi:hypothetical protein